jgi:hypothetical protein
LTGRIDDADLDADPDPAFYLFRIRMRIRILNLFYPDVDPDLTFHPDADPEPDPIFQRKAETPEKVLKQVHIPYILAVICKLMRIRIQLFTLMRIRILISV